MVIYIVLVVLVLVPLLAIVLLSVIGFVRPEVRRKGLRQLRQPFFVGPVHESSFALQKNRRLLEEEAIRRFGQPKAEHDVEGEH